MWTANLKLRMTLAACLLPFAAIAPYVLVDPTLTVFNWAVDSYYIPFYAVLFFSAFVSLLCVWLLLNVFLMGRLIFLVSSLLITTASSIFAMLEHQHALLVCIFLIAAGLIFISEWMRKVLELPFYDSKRRWWESFPKGLPHTDVSVSSDATQGENISARLVNFGKEGCFVFLSAGKWKIRPARIQIKFKGGDSIESKVKPVLYTKDRQGVGLKFIGDISPDWQKELSDYIDDLRRRGYVLD